MAKQLTYKDSGVDVEEADRFVEAMSSLVRGTYGPSVIDSHGAFVGLYDLDGGEVLFRKRYRHPALVACTDGVGTKLKIAFMMDKHDTVGIDLVAMNVNDLAVCGAEPLFFLDYISTGKVQAEKLVQVIKGITDGCRQAGCSLLGGETAEMPGFYAPGEYDLAGFAVGVVERDRRIDGSRIEAGDKIIGIASSGVHSNGYSLVRKVFFDEAKMTVDQHVDELGTTLGEELLRPTRIYVRAVRAVLNSYRVKNIVKGIVHITGSGFWGNIPRIVSRGYSARIELGSWPVPPIFEIIQRLGNIEQHEMFLTFNMGIGMMMIVAPWYADAIMKRLEHAGERAYLIGRIKRGGKRVELI